MNGISKAFAFLAVFSVLTACPRLRGESIDVTQLPDTVWECENQGHGSSKSPDLAHDGDWDTFWAANYSSERAGFNTLICTARLPRSFPIDSIISKLSARASAFGPPDIGREVSAEVQYMPLDGIFSRVPHPLAYEHIGPIRDPFQGEIGFFWDEVEMSSLALQDVTALRWVVHTSSFSNHDTAADGFLEMFELQATVDLGNDVTFCSKGIDIHCRVRSGEMGGFGIWFGEVENAGFLSAKYLVDPPANAPDEFDFLIRPGNQFWDVEFDGSFVGSVMIELEYDDTIIPGPENKLKVFHLSDGTLTKLDILERNTVDNTVKVAVDSFSRISIGIPASADLTNNGFVDFEDLTILLANWNKPGATRVEGNLSNTAGSSVDFNDLTVLLADWTGPGPAGSPEAALGTEAVPEPSSLMLGVIATLGLSVGWRRRPRAF